MSSDSRSRHKVQKKSILNRNEEHDPGLCNKKIKCVTGSSYKAFFKKQCTQITSDDAHAHLMGKGCERTGDDNSKKDLSASSRKLLDGDRIVISEKTIPSKREVVKVERTGDDSSKRDLSASSRNLLDGDRIVISEKTIPSKRKVVKLERTGDDSSKKDLSASSRKLLDGERIVISEKTIPSSERKVVKLERTGDDSSKKDLSASSRKLLNGDRIAISEKTIPSKREVVKLEWRGDDSSKMDISASSRKLLDGDRIVISKKTILSKRKVIKLDKVVCTSARAAGKAISHPKERGVSSPVLDEDDSSKKDLSASSWKLLDGDRIVISEKTIPSKRKLIKLDEAVCTSARAAGKAINHPKERGVSSPVLEGDASSKKDLSASSRKLLDGDRIVISEKTIPSKRKLIKLNEAVCTSARAAGKAINHLKERTVSSPVPKRRRVEKSKNDSRDTRIPKNQEPPLNSRVSPRKSFMDKKENAKTIKGVESELEKEMEILKEKHQMEIKDFHRRWAWERVAIQDDHKMKSAQICSKNTPAIRSYKLKEFDIKMASKMKEHELEKNKCFKDLLCILEKKELQKAAHRSLPPNPVLENDSSQPLKCTQMCDEGNNGTSLQILSSTCKNFDIGANNKVNNENVSIQPPERPELSLPMKKRTHNVELCIQREAPNMVDSGAMETEIDQVKDSSVDHSETNVVHSSLQAENMPNECETVPELEAAANIYIVMPMKKRIHNMEPCVQSETPIMVDSGAMETEIDQVKESSVDHSEANMVRSSLQAENMPNEREAVPELEAAAHISIEMPMKKRIHTMELCVQSKTPNMVDSVAMETVIDQVKDTSVDHSEANMVYSSLQAENMQKERETIPKLEAAANISIEVAIPNVINRRSLEIVPSQMPLHSASLPVAQYQTDLALTSYAADPLRVGFETLCIQYELCIQLHEATKLRLKSDEENETAQIKRKYEAKLLEAEVEFLKQKQEIDMKRMIVGTNRAFTMVSRLMNRRGFAGAKPGSSFPFMNQFNRKG